MIDGSYIGCGAAKTRSIWNSKQYIMRCAFTRKVAYDPHESVQEDELPKLLPKNVTLQGREGQSCARMARKKEERRAKQWAMSSMY